MNGKQRRQGGSALVITLCFLVILTVAVLVFFVEAQLRRQITLGSVGQMRVQALASSAVDILVSELTAEMASTNRSMIFDSSGAVVGGTLTNGPFVFQPRAAGNAVPERSGTLEASWTNMVKRSFPSDGGSLALYDGGRALVAADSSADTTRPSFNGRYLDDLVWSMPQLLTAGSTNVSPRWCYVTREGIRSVSDADVPVLRDPAGSGAVIGRFAYVIYDVGGLLDINAAGNALSPAENASRGLVNQVDLTRIPGVDAAGFLAWRSPVTGSDPGWLLSGTNSLDRLRTGDQMFVGRQDLIRYSRQHPAILSTNALPLLTTFSRERNAPSWSPPYNANDYGGSGFAYRDNANVATSTNRFLPNVRMPGAVTLTNHLATGGAVTYSVKAGDPAVQRRFPLNRLNWLGRNGPQNGGTPASIQACFGLQWNNNRWEYVGPTGNTTRTSIAILDEVAGEGREPNFFELLQAGILQGSLGVASGPTMVLADSSFANASNQVMQIGANILDQWDADSYPTRIAFHGTEFYGSESIPYLNKIVYSLYRPVSGPTLTGSNGTIVRARIDGWTEFEVWNPYQGGSAEQPREFRILQTNGSARLMVDRALPALGSGNSTGVVLAPAAIGGRWLTLTLASNQTVEDPAVFDTLRQSGADVQGADLRDLFSEVNGNGVPVSYTGIWCGEAFLDPNWQYPDLIRSRLHYDADTTYEWQINYASSGAPDWRTVQKFTIDDSPSNLNGYATAAQPGNDNLPQLSFQYLDAEPNKRRSALAAVDPRTGRFGLGFVAGASLRGLPNNSPIWNRTLFWSTINTDQLQDLSGANGAGFIPNTLRGPGTARRATFRFGDNRGSGGANDPLYKDPDGVQRFGDAISNLSNGVFPTFPFATHAADRPIILNRPFRSVGELGYVFRDLPFKTLDFWTEKSADAGLLDLFCIGDASPETGVVAGKVNLNTPHSVVLQAVLSGVTLTDLDPANNQLSAVEAKSVADKLIEITSGVNGPLLNKSEIATRLTENSTLTDLRKTRREAVVRALTAIGQTRTWNLLLDVVAQSGRLSASATNLSQFQVEGEARYWAHVAIDRYTGKVVDIQIEPVKEF